MSSPTCFFAVDIGNSGLRIARIRPANATLDNPLRINWLHPGQAARVQSVVHEICGDTQRYPPASDSWLPVLTHWVGQFGSTPDCLWMVSSVRQDALETLRRFVQQARQADRLHVIRYSDVPLHVAVDVPARLGIDRLLAAFAASQVVPGLRPLVVIQAGSAVTVDVVETGQETGDRFAGGAILPGVPMMLRLLGQAADMLPELDADDLTMLPPIPGKNTEAAMLCGAASGLVGGIQHLVGRLRQMYGTGTPVVISGGDGMRLSPNIPEPVTVVPDLVLQGILRLASLNSAL